MTPACSLRAVAPPTGAAAASTPPRAARAGLWSYPHISEPTSPRTWTLTPTPRPCSSRLPAAGVQGGSQVGSARDGNNVVLNDGRAAFQSVFHIHLHVVPRQNGDKLSFAKGMLLRRDPDREKTGRTLREALEKVDATE